MWNFIIGGAIAAYLIWVVVRQVKLTRQGKSCGGDCGGCGGCPSVSACPENEQNPPN